MSTDTFLRSMPEAKPVKLLYILNVANRLNNFSYSSMMAAMNLGFDFHIAGNWGYATRLEREEDEKRWGVKIHQIDFFRNPLHSDNFRAIGQLDHLLKSERFDIIHCNTPIGGLTGRVLGKKHRISQIIYQVHGFHFFQGAALSHWLLYYPVEKFLARWTDTMICINKEDYELAKRKMRLRNNGPIVYLPGIGIQTECLANASADRSAIRRELGIPLEAFLLFSVGELNQNKNHMVVIEAIADLPKVHYMIAGKGPLEHELYEKAVSLGIEDRLHLLGFRNDIPALNKVADAFCLPSLREGLSVSLMEAMAAGLPVACSDIRGNRDLLAHDADRFLIPPQDVCGFAAAIRYLSTSPAARTEAGKANIAAIKEYDMQRVIDMLQAIYQQVADKLSEGAVMG